jgi:hypothetical protein
VYDDYEDTETLGKSALQTLEAHNKGKELKPVDHSKIFTHSLTHSLTYSLTHLLTYLLTYLLTHLLTHSLPSGKIEYPKFRKNLYIEAKALHELTPEAVQEIRDDLEIKVAPIKGTPVPIDNWDQSGLSDRILGTHSLTYSLLLTYLLTYLLTHSLIHSLLLTHSSTYSLTLTYLLTHASTYSLTHSYLLTHSLTHFLTHS